MNEKNNEKKTTFRIIRVNKISNYNIKKRELELIKQEEERKKAERMKKIEEEMEQIEIERKQRRKNLFKKL